MSQVFLGRDSELRAVRSLVEDARGFAALLLEGEPGIGKTTLWAEGVARFRAAGFTALLSRPAESEVRLSYAALGDLLESVPEDVLASLPPLQREALEVALLRGARAPRVADLRSVAAGVRNTILALAETAPVLIALDDLQWLDAASSNALMFALRRIGDAPVRILATRRVGAYAAVLDSEVLRIEPLSLAAVHELLKERIGCSLPRPLLLRVYETCGGNPFYALEIGRELVDTHAAVGDPLPVPKDLGRLVRRRLGRLSPETREALLFAAAATAPTHQVLLHVLARDPTPALDEGVEVEVLEVEGETIRFAHPLYAAAIYTGAQPSRRREVHRRLSEAAEGLEERARHLGLAATAASAEVAEVLELAARQARSRGATAAAAELFGRSAELTPSGRKAKLGRMRDHAECLFESGNTRAAVRSLETLLAATAPGPERAETLLQLATILWFDDHLRSVDLAEQALREARGRRQRGLAHARLSWMVNDVGVVQRHAKAALELLDQAEEPELYAFALLNWAENEFHAGRGDHSAEIQRGRELQGINFRWDYSTIPACSAKEMDRLDDARAEFELYVKRAEELGDDSSLATHLVHLAEISLWVGQWDRAESEARDSLALVEQTGQRMFLPVALYANALVDTHRGRVEAARGRLAEARKVMALEDDGGVFVDVALGFLELSLGNHEAADCAFTRADARLEARGIVEPGRWRFHPDHIEAVLASGDVARAETLLCRLQHRATTVPRPWITGAAARCEALVFAAQGRSDSALEAARTAIHSYERSHLPFELARALLAQGQIQRRAKRKAAAKESLTRALVILDELKAPLWAERARTELSRIGLRSPAGDQLTQTERQVAELAAAGLKNREVAAQLFMSPKTVGANLSRVYRKLGIRSRAELGARFGSGIDSAASGGSDRGRDRVTPARSGTP